MAAPSMIVGTIQGISKIDYDRMKNDLRLRFDEVVWKDGALLIKSSRDHQKLKKVFTRIADCVHPGNFGSLLYIGHGNVACFFFAHKKYVGKKYREPAPPGWWGLPSP